MRWFVTHYADHYSILCSIYFVVKICSLLVSCNSLSQTNVIKRMSGRNTGLLTQHHQTNRNAVVGIIFLFNLPENITSYSLNFMLCDLPAWFSTCSCGIAVCQHISHQLVTKQKTNQTNPAPSQKKRKNAT